MSELAASKIVISEVFKLEHTGTHTIFRHIYSESFHGCTCYLEH
jgi:hypothetical protein